MTHGTTYSVATGARVTCTRCRRNACAAIHHDTRKAWRTWCYACRRLISDRERCTARNRKRDAAKPKRRFAGAA